MQSLRTKIAVLLAITAGMVALAAGLLVYGLNTSRALIDKAQQAQTRVEQHLLLVGRISDYGNAAVNSASSPSPALPAAARLEQAKATVDPLFEALQNLNRLEVEGETGDAKTAAATKGLNLARMRAQFDSLHRAFAGGAIANATVETTQARLDAFGLGFSPILAQAIEDDRQLSDRLHERIDVLRKTLTRIAGGLALGAILVAGLLYGLIGRPLQTRIAATISGANAIAGGRLDTRLQPSGRDELSDLMVAFNAMASSLTNRETDLRDGQRRLQETIDEKTAELRRANAQLEEIDTTRRRFFSDISHELRTPLTVVQGEAEFNLKPNAKPRTADMRKSFATILGRVHGLRRRVDDMLRIARSESGKLDLARQPVDLNAIAADVAQSERDLCARYGIAIASEPAPGAVTVSGDRDWLRQVMSGLISNAVKHSQQGTRIRLTVRMAGATGELLVTDQGSGIADGDLPHVFDRFSRGGITRTPVDGFGVGLSLARWVVQEHGGEIGIGNNPDGRGAFVRIALPLVAAPRKEERTL